MSDADAGTKAKSFDAPAIIKFVIAAWVSWAVVVLVGVFAFKTEWSTWGQFGDAFGSYNALFTALAFAVVWWSGHMQREELILQRKELKAQREELVLQRGEMQDTRSVMKQQQFEATFFGMLRLLREYENEIEIPSIGSPASGRQAWGEVLRRITPEIKKLKDDGVDLSEHVIVNIYEEKMRNFENVLSPYFRTLYNLLKLISGTFTEGSEDRKFYGNIVRAGLDSRQIQVLAMNALCSFAGDMRNYLEEYRILKYCQDGIVKDAVIKFYVTAFDARSD